MGDVDLRNLPADLGELSETELKSVASQLDIAGRSSMDRKELQKAVEKRLQERPPTI